MASKKKKIGSPKASQGEKRRLTVIDTTAAGKSPEAMEKHRLIEEKRRHLEQKLLNEMLHLVQIGYGVRSSRFTQQTLLETTRGLLNQIDSHHQGEQILPSYLTNDESKFLKFEASNAFMFVTRIESSSFPIIYVTESVDRVLHFKPHQCLHQSLFAFIHPHDRSRVQNQLIHSTQHLYQKSSLECRLQRGNGAYSSVTIHGIVKRLDQTLTPVSVNELGDLHFVGVCFVPLTSDCNERSTSLQENSTPLVFSCRCSPTDWKIFLVDSSVTTFPSVPSNIFRNHSILDFVDSADRASLHQAMINATTTVKDDVLVCNFNHPSTGILAMLVDVKPVFNASQQRTDFLELTFSQTDALVRSMTEIDYPLPVTNELAIGQ